MKKIIEFLKKNKRMIGACIVVALLMTLLVLICTIRGGISEIEISALKANILKLASCLGIFFIVFVCSIFLSIGTLKAIDSGVLDRAEEFLGKRITMRLDKRNHNIIYYNLTYLKYGAYIAICSHYNVFFETNNYLNFITVDKYFSADCILSAFDSYSIRTKSKDIAFLKEVDWDRIDEYILYGIN